MQAQLRDVEYFAAIAEHGQVQRAAAALGLSQPGLSKSLRRLEQAMNTQLLKRTPKGVELTAVGTALLARVGKLRLSLDDVTREIVDLSEGRTGSIRVGMGAEASLRLVPAACETFMKESPNVTFKLMVSETSTTLANLRNGTLDIAVISSQSFHHEDLVVEHTHDNTFSVYASAKHRLARRTSLSLADLVRERWVMASIDGQSTRRVRQAHADAGLPPPAIAIETNNPTVRYQLVAASDLLTIISRQAVRHVAAQFGLVELTVKGFVFSHRGDIVYRKDAYLPPVAFRFIETLKATAKKISKESR
jgi:DNA-binding transcriptional LysR family regulator